MTDRISDDQFDREIRDFLAWQERDTAGAPSAFEMSARIEAHTGTGAIGQRVAPRLVWPLLAGLVIVALLGVLTAGATLLRHSSPPIANGWIAYSTSLPAVGRMDRRSGGDIFLARASETPRLIADWRHAGRDGSPGRNICPAFSPDGRRLLYAVEAFYGNDIVVLDVAPNGDITDTVRFHGAGSRWLSCPAWSSDGTRIAFVDTTNGEVTVRAPDGSPPSGGPAGLPGDPSIEDFTRPREATDPLLSPAGDRFVRLGDCGVVVAASDGTGARTIPLDYCPYAIAAWSPVGRQILVMQDNTGGFTIHAISVDGPTRDSIVASSTVYDQHSLPGRGDVTWQPVFR